MSKSLAQVALEERTRREVFHRSDHIPPLPENATRILSMLDREDTEPEDLEGLVRKDQVLVAKLLRMVNSPLYGLSREMTSIRDATMVVGFRGLRSLVLASCTAEHLKRDYAVYGFAPEGMWCHSLAVAVTCRALATRLRLPGDKVEELFIAGLLHDIGKLVLVSYLQNARGARQPGQSMRDWETRVCGLDHAEAGAMVAEKWQLHDILRDLLRSHHTVSPAGGMYETELAILRVADAVAKQRRDGYLADHATGDDDTEVRDVDLALLGLVNQWSEFRAELDDTIDQSISEMQAL